jgi:Fe-S cluster biosynthesis and repair protein YggX
VKNNNKISLEELWYEASDGEMYDAKYLAKIHYNAWCQWENLQQMYVKIEAYQKMYNVAHHYRKLLRREMIENGKAYWNKDGEFTLIGEI